MLLRVVAAAAILAAAALLGAASAEPLDALIEQCAQCHGDGQRPAATPETPTLNGQPEFYALYQLVYFRQGQRKQTAMNDLVRDLGDDTLRALAKWVAELPDAPPDQGEPDPARYKRGAELARQHRCPVCHNPDFAGREHIPRLAGQREAYLSKALRDYKAGHRIGIQAAMVEVLTEIDDAGLDDLAHYLAHFRP